MTRNIRVTMSHDEVRLLRRLLVREINRRREELIRAAPHSRERAEASNLYLASHAVLEVLFKATHGEHTKCN